MKTIVFFIAGILPGLVLAQKVKESEVPKAVLGSFQDNFNGSKVKKWEKEEGKYEAEFDRNKVEVSATFSAEGKLLETETEIKVDALPEVIGKYLAQNYPGYKVDEAAKIVESNGTVKYEAAVEKGKEEFDLLFDSSGRFLQKEIDKD